MEVIATIPDQLEFMNRTYEPSGEYRPPKGMEVFYGGKNYNGKSILVSHSHTAGLKPEFIYVECKNQRFLNERASNE